jgi:hypothetical protein
LPELEQREEVISGEFNSQDVANTLLVYARIGRKPGEWLMMLPEGRPGADIRADEITVCYKHAVGVYDNGEEAAGAADGAAGVAGGSDLRGVQLAVNCKNAVGVCDNGNNAGGADDGAAGAAGAGDIRGVQLAACCKHAVGVCE